MYLNTICYSARICGRDVLARERKLESCMSCTLHSPHDTYHRQFRFHRGMRRYRRQPVCCPVIPTRSGPSLHQQFSPSRFVWENTNIVLANLIVKQLFYHFSHTHLINIYVHQIMIKLSKIHSPMTSREKS